MNTLEARQLSGKNSRYEKMIQSIEKRIKEAAEQGKNQVECFVEDGYEKGIQKYFEKQGFKVFRQFAFAGTDFNFSW